MNIRTYGITIMFLYSYCISSSQFHVRQIFSLSGVEQRKYTYKMSFYDQYLLLKGFIFSWGILPFRVDIEVIKNSGICCNTCSYHTNYFEFYGYMLKDTGYINLLKQYAWNRDRVEIEDFMLYCFEKYKVICPLCGSYYGWHVAHPELVENKKN